jgi:hypothetical protein
MKPGRTMVIEANQEQMWTLRPDRKLVRLYVPDLPVAGLREPLKVVMDFDAATVDAIVDRLSVLRAQMLPKLERAKKRN